jgi:hypothetical protein
MDLFNSIFTWEVQAALKGLFDMALLAIIGLAAEALRRKYGVEVSQKRQNDIHRALTTGATALLEGKKLSDITADTKELIVLEVIEYAKRSVPDAIRKLGATDQVLDTLARSKLNMAVQGVIQVQGEV